MTTLKFIGDIHLGKKFPFTTAKSSATFDKLLEETLCNVMGTPTARYQLGDLFNDFNTSGETLIKGYTYAAQMKATLQGNHDTSNNTEKASGLKLLKDHLDCHVAWGEPTWYPEGSTNVVMVPHQLTQEKFEEALDAVIAYPKAKFNVLLLHSNFGDRPGTETENYLRRDRAAALNKHFSLIVSGHEHNFNTPMKGVVMLGSILPFSFGEMTDKHVMDYDTETGGYELVKTWSATNYQELSCDSLCDTPAKFIKITGVTDISSAVEVNRWILDRYKNSDVIAIKNDTELHRHDKQTDAPEKAEDWLTTIRWQCTGAQQVLLEDFCKS